MEKCYSRVKNMISMKGSFAQVLKPISEKVVAPYLKSWQYWGIVTADFDQIRENNDLTGFVIDVVTSRGTYRHVFKRKTDAEGFFVWEETETEQLKGVSR